MFLFLFLSFLPRVVSDWGATHSTVPSALAGLDQEMSGSSYFGPALAQAVAAGQVPQSRLDDMVLRILTGMFSAGIFDRWPSGYGNLTAKVSSPAHQDLAKRLADASTILLKNSNNQLPLDAATLVSIAVVGDANTVHGSGSGAVLPAAVVTPEQGIRARVPESCTVLAHMISTAPCSSQVSSCVAVVFMPSLFVCVLIIMFLLYGGRR